MSHSHGTSILLDPGRADALRGIVVGGTLNRLTRDDWQSVLDHSELRQYHADQIILRQGQLGSALWVIAEGEVRIERAEDSGATLLARLGLGSVIGEMSFLDESGASANVVADGDVMLLHFSGASIRTMTEESPEFAARFFHSLAATLSRRLRAANEQIQGNLDNLTGAAAGPYQTDRARSSVGRATDF